MDKQTVQEVFLEKAQFARLDKLKAEKCYIKSADIAKEHFGEKHVVYASQLSELGHAQAMQGNYSGAEKTFLLSLDIFHSYSV